MTTINELKQAADQAAQGRARIEAEARELYTAAAQLRERVDAAERTPLTPHPGLADDRHRLTLLEQTYSERRAALAQADLAAQRAAQRLSMAEMEATQALSYLERLYACRDDDIDIILLPIRRWREAQKACLETIERLLGADSEVREVRAIPPLDERVLA